MTLEELYATYVTTPVHALTPYDPLSWVFHYCKPGPYEDHTKCHAMLPTSKVRCSCPCHQTKGTP